MSKLDSTAGNEFFGAALDDYRLVACHLRPGFDGRAAVNRDLALHHGCLRPGPALENALFKQVLVKPLLHVRSR